MKELLKWLTKVIEAFGRLSVPSQVLAVCLVAMLCVTSVSLAALTGR